MACSHDIHICKGYPQVCEDAIIDHINLALKTSHNYLAMGYFLDRQDVALKRYCRFILHLSRKAREQAAKLMMMVNLLGVVSTIDKVPKPEENEWDSIKVVTERALSMEMNLNKSLYNTYWKVSNVGDGMMCEFLGKHFLHQQAHCLKELSDLLTIQRKLESHHRGLAEFLLDSLILNDDLKY